MSDGYFTLDICQGKYTYIYDEGKQKALRYGKEWRDLTGDKFVFSLAVELDEEHKELTRLRAENEKLQAALKRLHDAATDITDDEMSYSIREWWWNECSAAAAALKETGDD